MTDLSIQTAQRVSALVDGQLSGDEFARTLVALESSPQARAQWDTYHMLGDVMRTGQASLHPHDSEFLLRLRQRMVHDAIENVAVNQVKIGAIATNHHVPESANASSWRMVAGLASVAMVGVLSWQGLNWTNASDAASQSRLAQQSLPAATQTMPSAQLAGVEPSVAGPLLVRRDGTSALAMAAEPQVMIRDPQLDALLAAHRQFGGTSALQMPSGFLRNATFEEGGR